MFCDPRNTRPSARLPAAAMVRAARRLEDDTRKGEGGAHARSIEIGLTRWAGTSTLCRSSEESTVSCPCAVAAVCRRHSVGSRRCRCRTLELVVLPVCYALEDCQGTQPHRQGTETAAAQCTRGIVHLGRNTTRRCDRAARTNRKDDGPGRSRTDHAWRGQVVTTRRRVAGVAADETFAGQTALAESLSLFTRREPASARSARLPAAWRGGEPRTHRGRTRCRDAAHRRRIHHAQRRHEQSRRGALSPPRTCCPPPPLPISGTSWRRAHRRRRHRQHN